MPRHPSMSPLAVQNPLAEAMGPLTHLRHAHLLHGPIHTVHHQAELPSTPREVHEGIDELFKDRRSCWFLHSGPGLVHSVMPAKQGVTAPLQHLLPHPAEPPHH